MSIVVFVADALAFTTASKVDFSKLASHLTVLTIFGIKSLLL
jgi:hypothetical protein